MDTPVYDGTRPTSQPAARAWDAAATVCDPEIPVITIADLGILRGVEVDDEHPTHVRVVVTPTYSGCPAMGTIARELREVLTAAGFDEVTVESVLTPAWTTDWMSDEGRDALERYGIAPPQRRPADEPVPVTLGVRCPRCGSLEVAPLSRFGSTSCKALYQCRSCLEPFDHFKEL